ncbi:MAG: autotransporter outer membrane beta-barrel domain-containing protein [Deltaproteobacteria bacterium]|nr:autotransporter outer membrane beta-barrel domain-containing protein [Deltaproteobacteria bacterium]
MKKSLVLALGLVLLFLCSPLAAKDRDNQLESFSKLYWNYQSNKAMGAAPAAGDGGVSGVTFVIIPEFHYAHHGELHSVISDSALKSQGGKSTTGALTFIATKSFNDWFSLSFLYQFSYTDYDGGLMVPDLAMFSLDSHSEIIQSSHLVGVYANFMTDAGKFEISVMEAWDIFSGTETSIINQELGAPIIDRRKVDSFDDRVFSLILWWDKEFGTGSFIVDPYLGWRTVHVVLRDMNNWAEAPGTLRSDSSSTHLVSGGIKLKYLSGLFTGYIRGGVNYRLTSDAIPGFSTRAVAPNVVNVGYMTSWDRTVFSWGLGFSYVVPEYLIFDLGYNGGAGSDTDFHSASLSLIFPF